tara:strand:- start:139 stop:372 length:234 start_codon:yes stop_codon:yes gene_type:complete
VGNSWHCTLLLCDIRIDDMKKKYKVIKTISSHMGTLYKDEVVTLVEEGLEGGLKVRDATGRLWNVSKMQIGEIKNER